MDTARTIALVDDEPAFRVLAARWLQREGYSVVEFDSGEAALEGLACNIVDAVCLDLHMPGLNGLQALDRIRERDPDLPVIMLTAEDNPRVVVDAMQRGARDFLVKPCDRRRLVTVVRNAAELYRQALDIAALRREGESSDYYEIVGRSTVMRRLFRQLDRLRRSDISVLIHGESGTGKELVAKALHTAGPRRRGPFVAVNCAAIAESLQESELFGHERGAFTGAANRRSGVLEQADGGTLLLDEVAELSASLQAKLLRALQERRFHRVGGTVEVQSDFRVVAASHKRLEDEVAAGRFREDLFYRIAVFEVDVPPLRDRAGDVMLLADRFLAEFRAEQGRRSLEFSPRAAAALQRHDWPGNVRELRNAVHRGVVAADEDHVGVADLPRKVRLTSAPDPGAGVSDPELLGSAPGALLQQAATGGDYSLSTLERVAIEAALERTEGNLSEVCRQLGIGRTTLYRKLATYGIERS